MSRRGNSNPRQEPRNPLADGIHLERTWCPDEDAMLAALRLVLGLPARAVLLEGDLE
jgi:hypothetical protein